MDNILLYTYNPFGNYKRNSAKDLVMRIDVPGVRKVVLDTDHDLSELYKAIRRFRPDVVIGIGQSSKRGVKVERTFRNTVKRNGKEQRISQGPSNKAYRSNLPVSRMAAMLGCRVSDDAGKLNCNYSSYRLQDSIARGELKVKAGFIHVPNTKYFRRKEYLPRFERVMMFIQKGCKAAKGRAGRISREC
ncbi:MAG: hypothetical protein R6U32_07040 [Candidatus Woesearchaeota archaeon]